MEQINSFIVILIAAGFLIGLIVGVSASFIVLSFVRQDQTQLRK